VPAVEHALIAAAGVGSRLGHGMPKCLVEVGGRRIIEYQLDALRDVPQIRIVVGFMEHEVMSFVKALRSDVLFVRNPNFLKTTTLQSLHVAARWLTAPCLILDGDTIYGEASMKRFLALCADGRPTIGVSSDISEDPVFASVEGKPGAEVVTGFSRTERTGYEWANLALVPPEELVDVRTHVFERLRGLLPVRAAVIERLEVDTEQDLKKAELALAEGGALKTPAPGHVRAA
jgi:CTP:molybdopterin cytidylyltransferase MocA